MVFFLLRHSSVPVCSPVMKKHALFAVLAVVVVLVGGIGLLVARSLREQWRQEAGQRALDFVPQVAQRIQDFHRIKTQDGRTVWEIAAREAQYFEEEQEVVVREPLMRFYLKDGRAVGLRGQTGRVVLDGRELKQIEMSGGVEVQFADYTVQTDRARYQHASDQIVAPFPVQIHGRDLELGGEQMEVDVTAQRLRLFRNVTMTLRPATGGEERHDAGETLLPTHR